jgi:hypothetical protein
MADLLRVSGAGHLAEVKPVFTLVAYRRSAKFADNQSERADNSHEDREHERDLDGRELEPPAPNRRSAKKSDFGFIRPNRSQHL